jgi:hypothetical protein
MSASDGTRRQLLALEILQSLAWEQQCIEMMLDSEFDVVTMLSVLQQRMLQEDHKRHSWAAGQALNMIRNSSAADGMVLLHHQQLRTVLKEEKLWGTDQAMRARALRDSLTTQPGGRRNSVSRSRRNSVNRPKFQKVLYLVTLCSKNTRALTFENLGQPQHFDSQQQRS